MANNLILRERLCEPTFTMNLVLDGVAVVDETPVVAVDIYWRWEDDDAMEPEYLGTTTTGHELVVPFDLKGRSIRLFQIGKTAEGVATDQDIKEAEQVVFGPGLSPELATQVVIAGEDLVATNLVDLYDDAGDVKARKADATDNTRKAEAFVAAGALTGEEVTVYFGGNINRGLGFLTAGAVLYLSETAGGVTHVAPSGTGRIVQQVGTALSASSMVFEPQETIELV